MLSNLNKIVNEKMKITQQLLRDKEEKMTALETENAMLYLKLAQLQGSVRSSKEETNFLKKCNDMDVLEKEERKEKVIAVKNEVQKLKSDFDALRQSILELPNLFKTQLSSHDSGSNVANVLTAYSEKQTADTTDLNEKLRQTERDLRETKKQMEAERTRRRTLHNTLVELRGNIRVHCRIRPLLAALDCKNGSSDLLGLVGTQSEKIVNQNDDETISYKQLNTNGCGPRTRSFEYEKVYGPTDQQETVFYDVAPLLTSLLDGYNVCIMAYGQTGSGKTHTMVGDHELYDDVSRNYEECKEGVIPRSAKEIFNLIDERKKSSDCEYSLEVSVFEVYNNEIVDLLSSEKETKHAVFSASDGSQEIPSLTTKPIRTAKEVLEYVTFGMSHRHEDKTKVHSHSSRSHLIVQLNIYQTTTAAAAAEALKTSNIPRAISSTDISARASPYRQQKKTIPAPVIKRTKSPMPRRSNTSSSASRSPSPPVGTPVIRKTSVENNLHRGTLKTKLQLVDLAGSECVGMSGVTGSALRETSHINKSLSALADVLQALAESQPHIPYRNTKLTHVLQDTIGGDAKLLIMLCVSPAQKYSTESLQCLGFGSRARQVARGQVKKRRPSSLQLPNEILDGRNSGLQRSGSLKR